jgi:hypothetical protein
MYEIRGLHAGETDRSHTHLLLSSEAWFELSGYVNSYSNKITMLLVHEVRLCDV